MDGKAALTPRQVEQKLRRVAGRLERLLDQTEQAYAERLELYQAGVAAGVTHASLAEWTTTETRSCSSVAVSKALSKASLESAR